MKLVHEVWEDPTDHSVSMFVRSSEWRLKMLSPQAKLLRTFQAESRFEAFRIHYQLMGWGEWNAPDGLDDEPYDNSYEWPREARVEQ